MLANTKTITGWAVMDKKEGWALTAEGIKEHLHQVSQEKSMRGPTEGGRSSVQGVKLLYIRDYLYTHTAKEHPLKRKNRKHIFGFSSNAMCFLLVFLRVGRL